MPDIKSVPATNGHLGFLTAQQEALLFQTWQKLLAFFEEPWIADTSKSKKKKKDTKKGISDTNSIDEGIQKLAINSDVLDNASTSTVSLPDTASALDTNDCSSSLITKPFRRNVLLQEFWWLFGREDPDVMVLRFLRARKWNVDAGVKMLIEALKWRHRFGVRTMLIQGDASVPQHLMKSGKTFFYSRDNQGRLVGYIRVALHNKSAQTTEENERFTIMQMELARMLLEPGQETVTIVFDMTDFSLSCMDYGSIRFLIGCFEAFYPESLAACLVVNAPWIFGGCWKLIKPWLDPVVCSKIHMIKTQELSNFVPKSNIPKFMGGESAWEYSYIPPSSDDPSTVAVDSATITALFEKIEEMERKFSSLTLEIASKINSNTENTAEKIMERDALKNEISQIAFKMDSLLLPKCLYSRMGVLQGDKVVWDASTSAEKK